MSAQTILPAAAAVVPGSATFDFLRTLHPEGLAPHHLLIWTVTGDMKRSQWFRSIESAVAFVETCQADAIYFGVGLSAADRGPFARCKADEIAVLPGLVCDLDVAGPAHAKPGLPPTKEEARKILPLEFPPTLTVDSGHGLYGWWLFREPWQLESPDERERERAKALSQRWHHLLAENARRLGYVIDSVFDLSRVLRLVGTLNRKVAGDHRKVEVIEVSGRRYEPSDLERILDLMNVPEIEVRSVDEAGRIEHGDLHVMPGVNLAPELRQQIDALIQNDTDFARVWRREKRMPRDNSWSGFAQSIANLLALANLRDQAIIDVLTVHRREHGDAGKREPKALSFFVHTIATARKWATEQQERDRKRAEREAKQKEVEEQEAKECALIAEVSASDLDAQKRLAELLELDVHRLVQLGNDLEPGYRLELADGRSASIPSLAAMTSFAAFNRYVWRFLRTALPAKARRQWRAVSIALAKLIVVEDTGLGEVEVLISDLGEYFSQAYGTFFEDFPAVEYPGGPPAGRCSSKFPHSGLIRAETEQEFAVALRLLGLPRKADLAAVGVYYLERGLQSDVGGEVARAVFTMPPLYNWLRKYKERKYDAETLAKRLMEAGFEFRQTAMESGVRLKRVWRGRLADGEVDDHAFVSQEDRAAFGDVVHRTPVQ